MTVVCDTSPFLLLTRADRLSLLLTLYSMVVVPEAVLREIRVQEDALARQIQAYTNRSHVEREEARDDVLRRVDKAMGAGERAAIAIALDLGADLVVLDDERGRREARRHGLDVTGAIGVLIEAKEQDLVSSLRRELDRLVEAGLWVDEALYDRVLREYGE
jgi:Predicted nucleic acid-binding protein, contains PIN domain